MAEGLKDIDWEDLEVRCPCLLHPGNDAARLFHHHRRILGLHLLCVTKLVKGKAMSTPTTMRPGEVATAGPRRPGQQERGCQEQGGGGDGGEARPAANGDPGGGFHVRSWCLTSPGWRRWRWQWRPQRFSSRLKPPWFLELLTVLIVEDAGFAAGAQEGPDGVEGIGEEKRENGGEDEQVFRRIGEETGQIIFMNVLPRARGWRRG